MLPNVKICVASRSWPVFRDAFGQGPNLLLEHLNLPDIKLFVTELLNDATGFRELKAHDPKQANALEHEITLRSSGVFLWVVLVVRSLLDGLGRGDRISDMRLTLEELPTELEHLYELILKRLDPATGRRAAETFAIMRAARVPVPLSIFSEPKALLPEQKLSRCLLMERRLGSYCKGMLEVRVRANSIRKDHLVKLSDAPHIISSMEGQNDIAAFVNEVCDLDVEYLHRTVKDYLEKPAMKSQLAEWTVPDFNPNCSLSSGALACLKIADPQTIRPYDFLEPFVWSLHYAALFEARSGKPLKSVVDEIEKVRRGFSGNNEFQQSIARDYLVVLSSADSQKCFLAIALEFNLYKYVEAALEARPLGQSEVADYRFY